MTGEPDTIAARPTHPQRLPRRAASGSLCAQLNHGC